MLHYGNQKLNEPISDVRLRCVLFVYTNQSLSSVGDVVDTTFSQKSTDYFVDTIPYVLDCDW